MELNLKLLVLDCLYYKDAGIKQQIDAIDAQNLSELIYGDQPKYDWFDRIPEVLDQLAAIPLDDAQLARVDELSAEACHVHHLAMPNWDGEGEDFDLSSFAGIERMPNLTRLGFLNFEPIKDPELLLQSPVKAIYEYCGIDEALEARFTAAGIECE